MKLLRTIFCLAPILCLFVNLNAQCPSNPPLTDFSATPTESFCESDGTITIAGKTGGQAPYLHAIIAGPETRPGQNSNLFAALPAGTYTVEVRDFCGTILTKSVVVPGTHTPLTLLVTSDVVICGNDGMICGIAGGGGDTTGGTIDYMYRLIKVDVTPPDTIVQMQSNNCFDNLEEGDYDVQVFDECDNFQTRGHILGRKTFATAGAVNSDWIHSCDSIGVRLYMRNFGVGPSGEPPIDWEIISSSVPGYLGTSGVWNSMNDYDTLYYDDSYRGQSPPNNWIIQTTDACGIIKTSRYNFETAGSYTVTNDLGCDSVTVRPFKFGRFNCPDGTISFEITSGPAGFPLPPITPDNEYTIPHGDYCFEVIDCCMDTFNFCRNLYGTDLNFASFTNQRDFACAEGSINFRFNVSGAISPTTRVVTSAPAGYGNPLPDTVSNYSILDWRAIFKPPGTYCLEAIDACNLPIDTCVTFLDTLIFQSEVEVVPGCINENQVCMTYTSNEDIKFRLSGKPDIVGQAGTNMQICFVNVSAGSKFFYAFANNGFATNCPLVLETLVIPDYIPPSIEGAWGIECDGGTGLVTVAGQNGVEPYTYELFAGPVTRPLQSSPYFPGLPLGTYSVRIFDVCNNSYITDVDVEPATLLIRGYDGAGCIGDSLTFFVDSIFGATYSWTGPNGFTNNTSIVELTNADVSDAGTYTVNVVLEDESNNLCIDETLTVNVEVFSCVCSIQAFDATMVSCFNANNGLVTANSSSGAGGPFTYQWSSSQGGPLGNTQTIGSLPPGTYAVTITDAAGCSVSGDTTITQPSPLMLAVDITDVACFTTLTGEATITAQGGTPGYTYQWDSAAGSQTTATAGGLNPGTYTVTVTDMAGCLYIAAAVVGLEQCADCEICDAATSGTIDICAVLMGDPSNQIGTLDCDNGGIDNQTECDNGGNPADPSDDCQIATSAGNDICTIIGTNASHPLADQDCDDGGVSNYEECQNNGDPTDPADDCQVAVDADLSICALINYNAAHPLATLDCDGGGVINITECETGEDPSDPADDCTSAATASMDICALILGGQSSWATLDCDNGGVINAVECANGDDPANPQDDKACPSDPCEEAIANNLDICVVLAADPTNPLGTLDCDNGGIDNATECANNGEPDDPADDCTIAVNAGLNLCALIAGDPDHPFANQDCDGGGVINITECSTGEDPTDPADDCMAAIDAGENICQIINYDPAHPMATLDCDGGGIDNQTECANGGDPSDPIDDCTVVITDGLDLCVLIADEPNNPIGAADCDEDGVTNATECTDMTDPLDPCDFDSGSITLPVTADQSDCENLCPDITPITTILPGNIAGASAVGVAVEITELNGIDTDGTTILVRMPSDPRLAFLWDPNLTLVALTTVNNSNWNYLGNNGVVHTFQYVGNGNVINGGMTQAFGFESIYDPQSTDGQTTVTASIVPFGGGECNLLNDTDSERLVYFE